MARNFIAMIPGSKNVSSTNLLSKELYDLQSKRNKSLSNLDNQLRELKSKEETLQNQLSNIKALTFSEVDNTSKNLKLDLEENLKRLKAERTTKLLELKKRFDETLEEEVSKKEQKVKSEAEELDKLHMEIYDTMRKCHLSTKIVKVQDADKYPTENIAKAITTVQRDLAKKIKEFNSQKKLIRSSLNDLATTDMFKGPMLGFTKSVKAMMTREKKDKDFFDSAEITLNMLRLIVNNKRAKLDFADQAIEKNNEIVRTFNKLRDEIEENYKEAIKSLTKDLEGTIERETSQEYIENKESDNRLRLQNMLSDIRNQIASAEKLREGQLRTYDEEINSIKKRISECSKVIDFNDNTILDLENAVKEQSKLVTLRKRYEMLKTTDILDMSDMEIEEGDTNTELMAKFEAELADKLKKYSTNPEVMALTLEEHRTKLYKLKRQLDKYYNVLHRFKIGQKKAGEQVTEEDFILDTNNRSILVVYNKENSKKMIELVKYMTQQALLDVHPHALRVNILNPTIDVNWSDLPVDTDERDWKTGKLKKGKIYCQSVKPADISDIEEQLTEYLSKLQSKDLKGEDITTFIQKGRLNGAIIPQYVININHGHNSELMGNLAEQSDQHGVTNITFVRNNSELYAEDEGKFSLSEMAESLLESYSIVIEDVDSGKNKDYFDVQVYDRLAKIKETVAYKLVQPDENGRKIEFAKNALKLRTRFLAVNPPGFTTEDYVEAFIETYHETSAEDGIMLHFGYKDGDVSQPGFIYLDSDSDNVHLFIGGTTGGGKSNTVNVMLNVLKVQYAPSELMLFYLDFKIVEAMAHAKPYKMPHCMAISGTMCAQYVNSLMEYVVGEMKRRQDLFSTVGATNLKGYRKVMLKEVERLKGLGMIKEALELKRSLPTRTVLLVDEAAQAFQDENISELFKFNTTALSQLARSMGIHMVYVSQDPSKMPSEVMGNFKARACTKANKSVSGEVIGNDFASWPEHDVLGFFCSNVNGGDNDFNVRYMVPYNDTEFTTPMYNKLALRLVEERGDINRDPVIFDQEEKLRKFKFNKLVDNTKCTFTPKVREIPIGEPVKFMLKPEATKLMLSADAKQHITLTSSDPEMKMRIIRRIIEGHQEQISEYEDGALAVSLVFLKDKPYWFSYEKTLGASKEDIEDNIEYGGFTLMEMDKAQIKEYPLIENLCNVVGLDEDLNPLPWYYEAEEDEEAEPVLDDDGNQMGMPHDPDEMAVNLVFIFDSDVVDFRGDHYDSTLKPIFAELSSRNLHVIFVESSYSKTLDAEYIGYTIAHGISSIDFDVKLRGIPDQFVGYLTRGGELEVFKPLYYNVDDAKI